MESFKRNRNPEAGLRLYLVRMKSPLTGGEELIGSGRDLDVAVKFATAYSQKYGVHVWVKDADKTVFELHARKERVAAAGGAQ